MHPASRCWRSSDLTVLRDDDADRRRSRQFRGAQRRDRRHRRRAGQRPVRADRGADRAAPPGGRHVSVSGARTSPAPRRARVTAWGMAHIPEDRQRSGIIGNFTVAENMVLDSYYDAPLFARAAGRLAGRQRTCGGRGDDVRRAHAVGVSESRRICRAATSRSWSSRANCRATPSS